MHDDVGPFRQLLHLIGCRESARRREYIIARVAPDDHAAGGRVNAIGHMAYYVRRSDGADPHIAGEPDLLWLVLRVEGDRIDQIGWAACSALRDLGVALGNLAGLDECIGDVCDKLPAAHSEALRRNDIGAADGVDLWPGAIERPTQLDEVRKALRVIVMHVSEENRIELLRPYPEL